MLDLTAVLKASYNSSLEVRVGASLIVLKVEKFGKKSRFEVKCSRLTNQNGSYQYKTIFKTTYVAYKI